MESDKKKSDLSSIFEKCKQRAEAGDMQSQFLLAYYYMAGEYTEPDRDQAKFWYTKAAEQEHPQAQAILDKHFGYEPGATWQRPTRIRMIQKAAAEGDAEAQYELGLCHDDGLGVTWDNDEARRLFIKSAEQKYTPAMVRLGLYYLADTDPMEGIKLFLEAADLGDSEAQFMLGYCYATGEAVQKDATEAVKWYKKAAKQGHAEAQFYLGLYLYEGVGIKKDEDEGLKWLFKAAAQDNEAAIKYLELVMPSD
jgi:TPR repeat protein